MNNFLKTKEEKTEIEVVKKQLDETLKCTFRPILVSNKKENNSSSKFYEHFYEKYKQKILTNQKKKN